MPKDQKKKRKRAGTSAMSSQAAPVVSFAAHRLISPQLYLSNDKTPKLVVTTGSASLILIDVGTHVMLLVMLILTEVVAWGADLFVTANMEESNTCLASLVCPVLLQISCSRFQALLYCAMLHVHLQCKLLTEDFAEVCFPMTSIISSHIQYRDSR